MQWLTWVRRIQAIAQTGITYARDPYDRERYEELRHIAAEIIATYADLPVEQVAGMLALEKGYPTPKVDVRAVVFDAEGRLLLVRETSDGRWALPGGWADQGETPSEMAVREVYEEAGYEVSPTRLLAVYDKDRHQPEARLPAIYKIFIRCELAGGAPRTSLETDAVGFFGRHELPPLSAGRTSARQAARMFEYYDQPDLPADFD
ncbi:MAG TPA: NUDIX hydrolase [Symbiobacteriaceae bacterium]|jgi:ADP-ribose pyrophosphatase YjhB (NUDIX family)|nr:NUDIX hydrolase [Symbiobacteriaceae bacterium]